MLHLFLATGANYGFLERIHRKFIKWLLILKPSTHSYALYAEVGRFPLYNCIFNTATVNQIQRVNNNMDLSSWFFKVRNVLQLSGFACVWLFIC